MSGPTATQAEPAELFASTCWTIVFQAADTDSSKLASHALAALCEIYWRPIYFFLRRKGFDSHDAQDLTQGFFADLIENRSYLRATPTKGRFRSYLLGALKHFVADVRDHNRAEKRGGRAIRIPMAEADIAAPDRFGEGATAENVYEQEWADALLWRAFARLEKECALAGKSRIFDCLKLRLSPAKGSNVHYETLAKELGRPARTLRSDLTRLRTRYRFILREEVATTMQDPSLVDDELRHLCNIVAGNSDSRSTGFGRSKTARSLA